jgi:hypothetical protein
MSKHSGTVDELAKRLSQHFDEICSLSIADFLQLAFDNRLVVTINDCTSLPRLNLACLIL